MSAFDPTRTFASFTGNLYPVAGLNFGNCRVSSADCTFIRLDVKAIMTGVRVTAEWGEVVGTKVFISYSSKDSKSARAICSALESRGLSCWISSRDVGLGENFMDAIVRAISAAKVMVLVFSENANNSDDMKREIVLASSAMVTVIPVRVEDVVPKGAFAYQLATRQWIDLFEDWEAQIERLVTWIAGIAPATPNAQTNAGQANAERLAQEEKDRIRAAEAARLAEEETQRKKDDAEAQRIAEDNRRQQAEAQRIAEEQGQQQAEAERLAREEKDRIRAAEAARLAEEETQRKKDDAEAQRIAEDNQQAETQRIAEEQRQQQADAERLAQEEKDRIRAAETARPAEEETQKKKAAREAAAPSEKDARSRVFAVGAALIAAVAIASWFMARSDNPATASLTCSQDLNNRNYSGAIAACSQAIEFNPKDEVAYGNRCAAYINVTNYSAGVADCNQAIALNPKFGYAYGNRCIANLDLGHYRAGLADCNQAIALIPKFGNAYSARGDVYEKLGENAEAIADYQKALTINPSDQYVQNALKRLGASAAASGGR